MPILINEVSAEIEPQVIEPSESEPAQHQLPLSMNDIELARTLDRIKTRQDRLQVD